MPDEESSDSQIGWGIMSESLESEPGSSEASLEQSTATPDSTEAKVAKGCGIGCGSIVLLFVALLAFYSCSDSGNGGDSPRDTARQAEFVCEEWIREKLKAPSTAEFSGVTSTGSAASGYEVSGSVDAQNSFGATIRSTWVCSARLTADGKEWRGNATLLE